MENVNNIPKMTINGVEKEVRFLHLQHENKTIATTDIQSSMLKEAVLRMMNGAEASVVLNIGIARRHPDDLFIKKTGREVSKANMGSYLAKLTSVHLSSEGSTYEITYEDLILYFYAKHSSNHAKMRNGHVFI